nr:MAG TPA: hypothetical protein [Caudoviricetes sp.]
MIPCVPLYFAIYYYTVHMNVAHVIVDINKRRSELFASALIL